MRMTVQLDLPREAGSVPTVRRMLRSALAVLQVDGDAQNDLEIAITEACSNVVRHADGTENFEVSLDVADNRCSIDVRDTGNGFDPEAVGAANSSSESGRGLSLIKALGENVRMTSVPKQGSLIHFEKSFA